MIRQALLAAELAVGSPQPRPDSKPLHLVQRQIKDTSLLRTLKGLKEQLDNRRFEQSTNFMQGVCHIMLRNPYFSNIYDVIRSKLEEYVNE